MIGAILCAFGLHAWSYPRRYPTYRKCKECDREQYLHRRPNTLTESYQWDDIQ